MGEFEQAYNMIMQRLPFPLSVGRVCPHPCEARCRRGQVDEAVSIRHLKRFAADYAYEHGLEYRPQVGAKKPEHVAVIGAGPAGLSAAWDLVSDGYQVTVFEALPVAGGMLSVGIPEFRLPKKYVQYEIRNIERLGVKIELNTRITDVDRLLSTGYKAVLLAIGAHKGGKMGIPGEDMAGVYDAVDFLRAVSLGKPESIGRRVVIVGGGNSAVDAARVALRQGASEVRILYRREMADMPAYEEEIAAAEDEGVKIDPLTVPARILGGGGKVAGIECVKMELGRFDKSGRRSPKPIEGSGYTMGVDTVVEAVGQNPDSFVFDGSGLRASESGRLMADERTLATGKPGVFVAGDAYSGPASVIEAVAAGQRAASSIKRYLRGERLAPTVERNHFVAIPVPATPPSEEESKPKARARIDETSLAERAGNEETVLPYSLRQAMNEASRCLRCDLQV
ncbi:MAG: FAD-dependent oxidoreductase, partial [Dehalococcoidia bacterium]|nr:FAD-dependent oxidoreductase [Dehalococcoidia bacterium]